MSKSFWKNWETIPKYNSKQTIKSFEFCQNSWNNFGADEQTTVEFSNNSEANLEQFWKKFQSHLNSVRILEVWILHRIIISGVFFIKWTFFFHAIESISQVGFLWTESFLFKKISYITYWRTFIFKVANFWGGPFSSIANVCKVKNFFTK